MRQATPNTGLEQTTPNTSSEQPPSQPAAEEIKPLDIQYLSVSPSFAKNWNSDPGKDGLEVDFSVKDAQDYSIQVNGTIDVKAAAKHYDENFKEVSRTVIEKKGITVKDSDFNSVGYATIRVPYTSPPTKDESYGEITVTFNYGGKTFSDTANAYYT
jgi:hypothetical protein